MLLNQAFSQKYSLEITGGWGKYDSRLFLNDGNYGYYQGNIRFHRNTPNNKSILSSILIGFLYERRIDKYIEAEYLGIPVGVTGKVGERKIHFLLHLGLQPCYLLSSNQTNTYYNLQNIENVLLGLQTGAGFGFKLSPNVILSIQYQYNKDLTKRYVIEDGGLGPGTTFTELNGHAEMVSISIKFSLLGKAEKFNSGVPISDYYFDMY
jgi:hypothetical protein